ncbi:PALE CRESS, chloroplastic-like protein [Drosera capensis]
MESFLQFHHCHPTTVATAPLLSKPNLPASILSPFSCNFTASSISIRFASMVLRCTKSKEEQEVLENMPPDYYDDEWQAKQREKTKELERRRQEEDEEEERKVLEYREIAMRLKGFPEEDVIKARKLVASFIRAGEEVEEKIEEAAEKGELTELVLLVIWNRLDVARHDVGYHSSLAILFVEEITFSLFIPSKVSSQKMSKMRREEKDTIRSLDLLYRRVETEILRREATPAMRLLNDLLNLHDGFDDEGWRKECKKRMKAVFPSEDPMTILVPAGFDINTHQGPIPLPMEVDNVLLRIDFVREVDELLQEVRADIAKDEKAEGLNPESVAARLKQQEKQRTISQVKALLDLAINLAW